LLNGLLGLSGCAPGPIPVTATSGIAKQSPLVVATDSLRLLDSVRNRIVPVALYYTAGGVPGKPQKVALLNHGYGGKNTDYSFVARTLVAAGYYVASVQHELPTDVPMPTTGNLYEVRKPYWERGVQNMHFVLRELQHRQPADAGVLPTLAEKKRWGTTLIQLPVTKHNDMWDGATLAQQEEMQAYIAAFLRETPHTDR